MDAPRFLYAKTADGINIAYWTLGEGPPLVFLAIDASGFFSPEAWHVPGYRSFLESLAEKHQVIGLHARGFGLSSREVTDFSLDKLTLDLNAVVERLDLKRFAVFANWHFGLLSLNYALLHPKRISQLILWCAYANGLHAYVGSRAATIASLRDKDFDLYVETLLTNFIRSPNPADVDLFSTLFKNNIEQAAIQRLLTDASKVDLTPDLEKISQPVLVLQPPQHRVFNQATGLVLAAGIRNSRLLHIEGDVWVPSWNRNDALVAVIKEALGDPATTARTLDTTSHGGIQTILFTDIEGHTATMRRLGDEKGREVLREHERLTRSALAAHGGTEVKTLGDGFMASFASAQGAVECAISLQKAVTNAITEPLRIRIGINAGEPIAEDDDLFGSCVIVAARTAAQANGDEILVTDVVRQLLSGKGFVFRDRGETMLKGFEDPVRLFEVDWR